MKLISDILPAIEILEERSNLLDFQDSHFESICDLFRSSISDSGIGMICNVFPETLSRLLLAVCPNISSSNFQLQFPICYTPLFVYLFVPELAIVY